MELKKLQEIVDETSIKINENDVFNFLKIKKRWPHHYPWNQNTVEILANNKKLQSPFFDGDGYLNYDKWKRYYDLGFTTIISNVLDLNEDLRIMNKKLTSNTGLQINGNFYFSLPGQIPSFDYHDHDYDVIVKQIYGISEWVVDNKSFELKPNQSCIIPKTIKHKVVNKKEKKLSLTINLH